MNLMSLGGLSACLFKELLMVFEFSGLPIPRVPGTSCCKSSPFGFWMTRITLPIVVPCVTTTDNTLGHTCLLAASFKNTRPSFDTFNLVSVVEHWTRCKRQKWHTLSKVPHHSPWIPDRRHRFKLSITTIHYGTQTSQKEKATQTPLLYLPSAHSGTSIQM